MSLVMNTQHKRLLETLAGCPDGATEHNLISRMKFHPRVIEDLVRSRLATVSDASVWPNGRGERIQINRVRITQAGKYAVLTMNGKGK
jgi:hypothetical protein